MGPAVTLRMKDFGSIRCDLASKSVGICGGMWKEGREKLKGGRVERSGFKSRTGILNARKSRECCQILARIVQIAALRWELGNAVVKMSNCHAKAGESEFGRRERR